MMASQPGIAPPRLDQLVRRRRLFWGALAATGAILVAWILWRFNPTQHGFYPRCALYVTTGIQCPGCGGLRAIHQLLHGNFRQALSLNPIAVLSLPVAAFYTVRCIQSQWKGVPMTLPFRHKPHVWAILGGLVVGFTIARNLPIGRWLGW